MPRSKNSNLKKMTVQRCKDQLGIIYRNQIELCDKKNFNCSLSLVYFYFLWKNTHTHKKNRKLFHYRLPSPRINFYRKI